MIDLSKICADVLAWAGKGCTCEIERMDNFWAIHVTKGEHKQTMHLKDTIYAHVKDIEGMLKAHGRNGIYQLGRPQ